MIQAQPEGLDAVLRCPSTGQHYIPSYGATNAYLVRWLQRKYRRLRTLKKALACWQRITSQQPRLFAHWAWTAAFW